MMRSGTTSSGLAASWQYRDLPSLLSFLTAVQVSNPADCRDIVDYR
jgi:hypothetical protein